MSFWPYVRVNKVRWFYHPFEEKTDFSNWDYLLHLYEGETEKMLETTTYWKLTWTPQNWWLVDVFPFPFQAFFSASKKKPGVSFLQPRIVFVFSHQKNILPKSPHQTLRQLSTSKQRNGRCRRASFRSSGGHGLDTENAMVFQTWSIHWLVPPGLGWDPPQKTS